MKYGKQEYTIILYEQSGTFFILNTTFMTQVWLEKWELDKLIEDRHEYVINYDKNKGVLFDLHNKLFPIYHVGNGKYIVSDNKYNIRIMSTEGIKNEISRFGCTTLCGRGIRTKFGRVPYVTLRAYKHAKMEAFNNKCALMGKRLLKYKILDDETRTLVIQGPCGSTWEHNELIIPDIADEIDTGAFMYNSYINRVILGKNTKVVRRGAFFNCPNLHYIRLSKNTEILEDRAFANCGHSNSLGVRVDNYNIEDDIGSAFEHTKVDIRH